MTTLSHNLEDRLPTTTDINLREDATANYESLYRSHFWSNSDLPKGVVETPYMNKKLIKYTCKGKLKKYEVKSLQDNFVPVNHSTPDLNTGFKIIRTGDLRQESQKDYNLQEVPLNNINTIKDIEYNSDNSVEIDQAIPSISRQIDSSYRQKYTSKEIGPNEITEYRLRKSLKGIGCIVNFTLTENTVKKRTQIQACSISVMIVAIVVISFVLVNFTTPYYTRANSVVSTNVVPIETINISSTSSVAVATVNHIETSPFISEINNTEQSITTEVSVVINENHSLLSNTLAKIRKNIRTYPKNTKINRDNQKPKDVNNRDTSQKFCSCQINEVCMLEENSGKAVCITAIDIDDPTGCGGLCALETEACQLVDRSRGVRVCRLLTLVTCSPQEWRCHNGLCVPVESRCDGIIHCYDRSDEIHCDCDLTKQFRCGHSISCFSNTKLCDGIIDCWDGYDEVNCTTECPEEQFTCTDGQCVLSSRFCDGLADCADGSDEPRGCGDGCGAHEWRCNNHRCVPRAFRCDGYDHCGDATDELNCP